MIEGITVKMGGQEYIVPPLNFKQLRTLKPIIESFNQITSELSEKQMDGITHVIHAALSRNYPDLTLDKIEEMVDLGNAALIMNAIMGVSGLVQGEAQPGSR